MSVQDRCNALTYPPTHTYDVESLCPSGVLADRASVIESIAPSLFDGERFLDIGCNKGWFSLKAAAKCSYVLGIDPIPDYIDLCRSIAPSHCEFRVDSFKSLVAHGTFDRVFLGNGPHYPFIEYGGWSFVSKLAELSSDLLVTEGPVGMECVDMSSCIPPEIQPEFNRANLSAMMGQHWSIEATAKSPAYTPDRYIFVWKRIDDLIHCSMDLYANYLKIVYSKMAAWIDPSDAVVEIGVRHDRGVLSRDIIKCSSFDGLDLDPSRCPFGGYKSDVLRDSLPEPDVYISTAILHHINQTDVPRLLTRLRGTGAKRLIFTGPNVKVCPELIGDHKWHIHVKELITMANTAGWSIIGLDVVGLNQPYCELFVVMEKQ